MNHRVLVVEDEVGLCEAIAKGLADHGFAVDSTTNGFDGYRMAKRGDFDVIVLDWMLPGMAGDEVCHRLRPGVGHGHQGRAFRGERNRSSALPP